MPKKEKEYWNISFNIPKPISLFKLMKRNLGLILKILLILLLDYVVYVFTLVFLTIPNFIIVTSFHELIILISVILSFFVIPVFVFFVLFRNVLFKNGDKKNERRKRKERKSERSKN